MALVCVSFSCLMQRILLGENFKWLCLLELDSLTATILGKIQIGRVNPEYFLRLVACRPAEWQQAELGKRGVTMRYCLADRLDAYLMVWWARFWDRWGRSLPETSEGY